MIRFQPRILFATKPSTYLATTKIEHQPLVMATVKSLFVLCLLSSTVPTLTEAEHLFKRLSRVARRRAIHAPSEQYPWHVFISSVSCSGVLVRERWILTSGFCVQALKTQPSSAGLFPVEGSRESGQTTVFIRVGNHHIDFEIPGADLVPVREKFVYPRYNLNTSIGNFGLLYLARDITLPNVQSLSRVELPSLKFVNSILRVTNRLAKVTGWGHNSARQKTPFRTLKEDAVSLARVCLQRFTDGRNHGELVDKSWCVVAGTQGMCSIDQGSPLVIQRNHSWVIIGVYSRGETCVSGKHAILFSRIDYKVLEWMQTLFAAGGERRSMSVITLDVIRSHLFQLPIM